MLLCYYSVNILYIIYMLLYDINISYTVTII